MYVEPERLSKRWSKAENKRIEIKQPLILKEYKYAMRSTTNFADFSVAAGWLENRENAKVAGMLRKDTMDYLDFKLSVAKTLV